MVQLVIMSGTTSDNERMTTSGTTSDNEWYNEWQRTNDNEWHQETMSDNKWEGVRANNRYRSKHGHYAFLQIFPVGGASLTLDPSMKAVNCMTILENNKFILVASCLTFLSTAIWYELKKQWLSMSKSESSNMLNISQVFKKTYSAERFVQNKATLNTVTSLTVNSVMGIFLQVLQTFQDTINF